MKKISILLFAISGLLTVGFVIRLTADFICSYQFGSAPFYVYVVERGVEFLVPALLALIAALILHKRMKGKEE